MPNDDNAMEIITGQIDNMPDAIDYLLRAVSCALDRREIIPGDVLTAAAHINTLRHAERNAND